MSALDRQIDRITRVVLGPEIGDGEGVLNVASVDLDDSISRSQSGAFSGAAALDAFDQLAMLGVNVLIIETQFHQNWPVVAVHPKTAVKNGGSGKERRQGGQQRFGERRPAHDWAGQRQGVCTGEGPDEA